MTNRHPARFRGAGLVCAIVVCLAIGRMALGWGAGGHQYVAALAVQDLPDGPLKILYRTNLGWLETNSSFPDRWLARKDVGEPGRHYIHMEDFRRTGEGEAIPRRYAEAVDAVGYDKLRADGTLPWTVERHYKLLVEAWSKGQWDAVLFESAMLSHYVADAHVPFHTTANNDGQLSQPPQTGIQRRFVSDLVEQNLRISDLHTGPPVTVHDPQATVFLALRQSADLVPILMGADRRAVDLSGGAYNAAYWQSFGATALPIAAARIERAGTILAGLLLHAWTAAGRPRPPTDFIMSDRFLPFAPAVVGTGIPALPAMPYVSIEARQAARGGAKVIKVASKLLKRDVAVTLILPTDYATTTRRYPVLYLLHGSGGSESDWIDRTGVAAFVAGMPLIVVMPDADNSWYINSPIQGAYEDFFTNELLPTIDTAYRTRPERSARAVAGNSMGGYGAWRLALDHPDLFTCAASLSGALDMGVTDPGSGEPSQWLSDLYGNSGAARLREYHRDSLYPRIERLALHGQWRGPSLYFDAGSHDYLLSGDQHMDRFLQEHALPFEYAEFASGEHSWTYWDEHIRDALQFVQRHLAPPTAF